MRHGQVKQDTVATSSLPGPRQDGVPRLAVVLDHPAQHFSPALRLLDHDARLEVRVFYWRADVSELVDEGFDQRVSWDIDLLAGYDWTAPDRHGLRGTQQLTRALQSFGPDVVLAFGWATPVSRLGLLWSLLSRTPAFLYGDSTWQGGRRSMRAAVRALLLRVLFKLVAGALSSGTFNREFYIRYGMHPSRIRNGIYPADVEYYRSHADRAAAREHHGVAEDVFIIGYAGKLIARKGVDELLRAAVLLPEDKAWEVIIVGDGPQREELERLVEDLGVTGRVRFLGFQNQSSMPGLLGMCDVVVVPSYRDMRVLVCVEAMAAGAAVVVSSGTAVWGNGDLIEHGRTGLVYRSGNARALASHLHLSMRNQGLLKELRVNGAIAADNHSAEAFRDRVVAAFADNGGA